MGCCLASKPLNMPDAHAETCASERVVTSRKLVLRPEYFVHKCQGRLETLYRIKRLIGRGMTQTGVYGNVFEAVHLASGTLRAVKVVNRSLIPEVIFGDSLPEVGILTLLVTATQDHPHIIKVYEVIVESDYINVVFELCLGELFEKKQQTRYFPENRVVEYMRQLLSAVAYCHDRRIVHRDLKLENLVLESDAPGAMLKVIDFGTSVQVQSSQYLSEACGTVSATQPFYQAPEVRSKHYNEKCDLWSCGVVMYLLLLSTGSEKDANLAEALSLGQVSVESLCERLRCSAPAKDLLRQLLSSDPSQRPSARQALSHPCLRSHLSCRANVQKNLAKFGGSDFPLLRQAVCMYIATQLTSLQETEAIRRAFVHMDADGDGQLNSEDLAKHFDSVSAFKILRDCNLSGSGALSYTEFLTACMSWPQAFSDLRLEVAFKAFDDDNNGRIYLREIQKVFRDPTLDIDVEAWAGVLGGQRSFIELKDFKSLMRRQSISVQPESPLSTCPDSPRTSPKNLSSIFYFPGRLHLRRKLRENFHFLQKWSRTLLDIAL